MTRVFGSRVKDPQDKKNVGIDWDSRGFLTERATTITTSTWTIPTGITEFASSNTTTKAIVTLTGGTADANYTITNHVVLANGEEFDGSVLVRVRSL